ncbi:MAG: V-type ATP synthase subunit E [Armatimonadota bacterium]|nr:V-type ATP synthase subunit E [Armatimonadota bacterium]
MATDSELITLLQREATAEREQVLAEARRQADQILAEARRQADQILAEARARLAAEERAALVKAQSAAHLRASSMVLQAKEEEIARVFARAEEELAGFIGDREHYPAVLRAFIEEGLQAFPGRAVVTVNPADLALAQAFLQERGGEVAVQGDPAVRGGARVTSPDGRFVVINTLASRLERARPALAAEVADILWE